MHHVLTLLVIAGLGGVIGYILGYSRRPRSRDLHPGYDTEEQDR